MDHPDTVENYRFAHAVRERSLTQQASTEDLREALLRYRSLFDDLLRPEGNDAAAVTDDRVRPAAPESRRRVTDEPETQPDIAAGQPDGPRAGESDIADPAASNADYDDQRIGRRDA